MPKTAILEWSCINVFEPDPIADDIDIAWRDWRRCRLNFPPKKAAKAMTAVSTRLFTFVFVLFTFWKAPTNIMQKKQKHPVYQLLKS